MNGSIGFWQGIGIAASSFAMAIFANWQAKRSEAERHKNERLKAINPKIPIKVTHKVDMEIIVVLSILLKELRAQRTYVSKFHNGDRYIDGSDILKKTRTHERVRPGISYQAEYFKGQLVSTMQEEIALVLESGPSYRTIEDLPESKFKWLCEQGGVKAVSRCKIPVRGQIVGFVGVDFDELPWPCTNGLTIPEKIGLICDAAESIGYWLAQVIPLEP